MLLLPGPIMHFFPTFWGNDLMTMIRRRCTVSLVDPDSNVELNICEFTATVSDIRAYIAVVDMENILKYFRFSNCF